MNLKPPQISPQPILQPSAQQFLELLQTGEDLRGLRCSEITLSPAQGSTLSPSQEGAFGLCFQDVVFDACRLVGANLARASFVDVLFQNCDFSNCDLSNSYFNRCSLQNCKWLGADLNHSKLQQVSIENSNLRYANFDRCQFQTMAIRQTDCSFANLSLCRIKQLELQTVNWQHASFFQTSLAGVDFSQCELAEIALSETKFELQGAIVNLGQAAELAKLLGLVIKA